MRRALDFIQTINWPWFAALGFTGAFWYTAITGLAPMLAAPASPAVYEIQATTESGDFYIAGSGDTCATAWQGAALPGDWREIICVQVR